MGPRPRGLAAGGRPRRPHRGDGRAVVLPGQLYAYYDWGGTIDPILPALAEKPVAIRNAVGYADLRATDLLWTTDALVQQRRAVPGQLNPLLDLMGARTVISGARRRPRPQRRRAPRRRRRGARRNSAAERVVDGAVAVGRDGRAARRARLGPPGRPGLVRVEPLEPQTVVDGSAEGLAAAGKLESPAYAADLTPEQIRKAPEVVITDSNRRRVFVVSRLVQNAGPTLAADEEPSVDAAVLDPFGMGSDAQTVAVYDGIKAVRTQSSPGFPQFPERRPFAALDGDPATHWQADRALVPDRYTLDVTFDAPRDVDHVDLLPYDDRKVRVVAVRHQRPPARGARGLEPPEPRAEGREPR